MKINKKKLFIFSLILLLISMYFYYTKPNICLKSYEGIRCRINNESYKENVTIKLDGKYTKKPFSYDIFEGDLYINDDILKNVKLEFDKFNNSPIRYDDKKSNTLTTYGYIMISDNMDKLTILVVEKDINNDSKSWHYENGLIISAPTDTKENAIKIADQLLTKPHQ